MSSPRFRLFLIATLCASPVCLSVDGAAFANRSNTHADVAARVEERLEYHSNGQLLSRGKLDREGRLNGDYVEYYETGVVALEAKYKKGELSGKYASFHENGEPWITTTYANGVISGKYIDMSRDGVRRVQGVYKRGLREGNFEVIEARQTLRVQGWKADELVTLDEVEVHPRSLSMVRETLAEIYDPEQRWGGADVGFIDQPSGEKRPDTTPMTFERDAALRRLLAYRFLAGVAWRDMQVSARFNYHADAAARLLLEVGSLSAKPENPGWSKKEFGHASLGAMGCNQAYAPTLSAALIQGMAEMGRGNAGFRTSFLDPQLLTTGFARCETVNTLWYDDASRSFGPDWQMIAFPAPGYMPLEYFGPQHSWSIELNPANHAAIAFKNDVAVQLYRLDDDWVRDGDPLELDYTNFFDRIIAFRPLATDCTVGARYEVRVEGIRHDKVGSALTYFVEFVEAADSKQAGPGKLEAQNSNEH